MADLVILILFLISGAITGWIGVSWLPQETLDHITNIRNLKIALSGLTALIGLLIAFLFQQFRNKLTNTIRTMPTDLLFSRSVGIVLGLVTATLLLVPVLLLPLPAELFFVKPIFAVLSNIFFGILGYNLADVHGRTVLRLFNPNSTESLLMADGILTPASAKVLDTSVIIDGRIQSLLRFGLIEGQIIVAQSVMDELQKLSDSSNNEKRGKGRRGLKLLNQLRESYGRRLVINSTRYEGEGTDEILLKLTSDISGILITVDYNLSQVALVQEIKVLNLSDLVLAIRPEVQPGEKLSLKVVREGKENSQGIAYLEDGTMVVIEEGLQWIGKRIEVVPLGLMRGRSFHESFIIADECQNASYDQLKMLLTRIGIDSKMVLTGDLDQSDLQSPRQGGLQSIIERLQGIDGVGFSKLETSDIVRNPIIADIVHRL